MKPPTYARRTSADRPASRTGPILLLFLLALPPAAVAILAVLGLGAGRGGSVLAVVIGALALGLLPALGISGLFRNRPAAMVVSLLVWSLALLLGLDLYFPGERAVAIARGASWLGSGGTGEPSERSLRFGLAVDRILGGSGTVAPPAPAEPSAPVPAPAPEGTPSSPPPAPPPAEAPAEKPAGEAASLEYHGEAHALRIPVVFEGPNGEVAVPWMVFDTGATLTTLDTATLSRLGISVPADAPEVTLHAATGEHRARLVLVDAATVGGYRVDGVTVAVCDTCAAGEARGLLGLNVSGQFRVTLDPDERRLLLRPQENAADRKLDLDAWLAPAATLRDGWNGGEALVRVANRARRHVDEVVLGIECPDRHHEVAVAAIPAFGTTEKTIPFPGAAECAGATIRILRGRW
jgi:hypothetical protein